MGSSNSSSSSSSADDCYTYKKSTKF